MQTGVAMAMPASYYALQRPPCMWGLDWGGGGANPPRETKKVDNNTGDGRPASGGGGLFV